MIRDVIKIAPPFSLIRSTYKIVRPPQNVLYGISGDTPEGVLRARAEHSCEPGEESVCDDRHQRLAQGAVGESDHSDISHSRGGPWARRRPGLRGNPHMHVCRPKHARV